MDAVQLTLNEKRVEIIRKPKPKVENPNDVIIKVFYSGISRKDLDVIDHILPCTSENFVLGHEVSGIVSDVGAKVKSVKKGDKVVVDPNSGCGLCDLCRTGTPNFCKSAEANHTIGFSKDGAWAQFVLVPESQVYKIPRDITLEHGFKPHAVLAEPMACVSHGWDVISPIPIGHKILLVGSGLLGDLWAALLHFQGHRRVTVSELNLERLEYVLKIVKDFDCITPDELTERQSKNPEYLFDLIIDTSGCGAAMEQEFTLLNSGGKLCIFGLKPPGVKISLSAFDIYQKEITIVGVNISTYNCPKALILLEAIQDRYLDFEMLGIKSYALSDFRNAIDHVRKGSVVKALFSNTVQCSCPQKKGDY